MPTFRIEETLAEIEECLEKGWTGLGYKTVEFEEAWQEYSGLEHAHFLNSATAGLHLAVRLLKENGGWKDGDEIVTTPLTFVSTNHAILYERLRPVFADVDQYLCLDPESVEERITDRTRAVMYVGVGGNAGQLDAISELCREKGLKLILDASHMAGTRLHGRHVGHQADATVFSFHAVKNLPTGDSGMICFSDEALDNDVRKWTWLGISKDTYSRTHSSGAYKWRYDVEHVGFKYHGNSIMAAMGLVALRYLDDDNGYRRQIAGWYDEELDERATRIPIAPGCESSHHLCQIEVDDRDRVMLWMNEQQVYPGVHYADNTQYRMYSYARGSCPRATDFSERLISLPLHLELNQEEIRLVSTAVLEGIEADGPI